MDIGEEHQPWLRVMLGGRARITERFSLEKLAERSRAHPGSGCGDVVKQARGGADWAPGVQVCLYTCGDLIASVPFFEDAEEGFTTSVVTLLRPAVHFAVKNISPHVSGLLLCTLSSSQRVGSCLIELRLRGHRCT